MGLTSNDHLAPLGGVSKRIGYQIVCHYLQRVTLPSHQPLQIFRELNIKPMFKGGMRVISQNALPVIQGRKTGY